MPSVTQIKVKEKVMDNPKKVIDNPKKVVEAFNNFFVNVGPNTEKKYSIQSYNQT